MDKLTATTCLNTTVTLYHCPRHGAAVAAMLTYRVQLIENPPKPQNNDAMWDAIAEKLYPKVADPKPATKRVLKHAIQTTEDGTKHITPICAECGKEAYHKLMFNPGPEAEIEVFYFCPMHKSEVAHKLLKGIGERDPETLFELYQDGTLDENGHIIDIDDVPSNRI